MPRLSPEIPLNLRREQAGRSLAQIAGALARAGLLDDGDYEDEEENAEYESRPLSFRELINCALFRRTEDIFPSGDQVRFPYDEMRLVYTDDIQNNVDAFDRSDPKGPVPAFCLLTDTAHVIPVCGGVNKLEEIEDHAGYSIYAVAARAVAWFNGVDCDWAVEMYESWDLMDEWHEEEGRLRTTDEMEQQHDSFLDSFPYKILKAEYHPKEVLALAARKKAHPIESKVARAAHMLNRRLNMLSSMDKGWNHVGRRMSNYSHVPPIALRWSGDDGMERVLDEHLDGLNQTGEGTRVFFTAEWKWGSQGLESVDAAVMDLLWALELLRLLQPILLYFSAYQPHEAPLVNALLVPEQEMIKAIKERMPI